MTTRMFLKMFGCARAIVVPEDSSGQSVIMIESEAEPDLVRAAKRVKNLEACEIMTESFQEMLDKLKKPIERKKIFVTSI